MSRLVNVSQLYDCAKTEHININNTMSKFININQKIKHYLKNFFLTEIRDMFIFSLL